MLGWLGSRWGLGPGGAFFVIANSLWPSSLWWLPPGICLFVYLCALTILVQ